MARVSLPNAQPVEKVEYDPEGHLDVFSIWKTFQGEGPFAGYPAVFVRLSGCNLQCNGCDTDYTSRRKRRSPQDVCDFVTASRGGDSIRLVVLTGGEPFRQNVTPLVAALTQRGYQVQIETNGTIDPPADFPFGDYPRVVSVCSPKTPRLCRTAPTHSAAFKYVLSHGYVDDKDGLPTSVLGNGLRPARPWDYREYLELNRFGPQVIVQPADEMDEAANAANLRAAVRSCRLYGYRLGLQLHKIIGVK